MIQVSKNDSNIHVHIFQCYQQCGRSKSETYGYNVLKETQVAAKLPQATNKHCSECLRASHWVAAKHKSAKVLPPRGTMQGQTNNTSAETALRMVRLGHRSLPSYEISHRLRIIGIFDPANMRTIMGSIGRTL